MSWAIGSDAGAGPDSESDSRLDSMSESGGEDVPGVGPLLVAEGNGTSLVFGSSFHGVELEFEVHLAWDYLMLRFANLIVAAQFFN